MNEIEKEELDRAMNLLIEARDIIESIKYNPINPKAYKSLEYALDKIEDAELDITEAQKAT